MNNSWHALKVAFGNEVAQYANSPAAEVINSPRTEGYDIRVLTTSSHCHSRVDATPLTTRAILGEIEGLLVDSGQALLQHAEVVIIGKRRSPSIRCSNSSASARCLT